MPNISDIVKCLLTYCFIFFHESPPPTLHDGFSSPLFRLPGSGLFIILVLV